MEKSNKLFLLFLMTVLLFSVVVTPVGSPFVHAENKPPVEYVDPLIGTDVYFPEGAMGEANVFPGATTPHGMVQLSPDTGRHIAGYLYSDDHIEGFSFTHFSGTGSWGFGNFLSTATTGELHTTENTYKSKFSHEEETASAGYYSVRLQDYDIQAELTATTRVGLLRYTFPESDTSHILLDASHTLEDEPVSDATIQVLDNETVVGSQTNPSPFHHGPTPYTIYVAAKFSQPFDSYGTWNGNRVREGSPSASGRDVGAFFNYNTDPGEQALVKVGISYVSTDNALANIEAEVPDWDFEQVKEQARNTWNERLSRIEVSGGSEEDKVKFYTSLYRALLGPYTFSDANGEYIGFDHKIHRAEGYTQYHTFSLWDTFRHAHPLYTLIEPEVQNDAVRSLIADYEQGGWLPRWPMANVYITAEVDIQNVGTYSHTENVQLYVDDEAVSS